MSKAKLLGIIRTRQAEIETLWAGANEDQMTERPGPQADWSVKDLIGHLLYWEQQVIAEVRIGLEGGIPDLSEEDDVVNARAFAANRDRPLDDILKAFARSHREMLTFVDSIPEDKLMDTEHFTWADDGSLYRHIVTEYLDHYDAHMPGLRAWRERAFVPSS
ncbi:MAG: ClbS/DfsB family four-helix bundle protein [Anaerolineae bacterium]|nr:ClbS/DfsB family four-helix bundle protein [Anaerolineae bacterium]